LSLAQHQPLADLCDELLKTVEELLRAGLTTASKSTVERIDVSFKEASRMKLLRLGSTLRIANEEISRFQSGSDQFSARRFAFFLNRTWLLAHSLRRAIDSGDEAAFQKLMFTPPTEPVQHLEVVTLGVSKRVVPGAFAAFEFRFRAVQDAGAVKAGEPLLWSCVFPMRKDLDLPAEAFLHLPQKQKFKPSCMLAKKVIVISACSISRQPTSTTRLMLAETSTVTAANAFTDWSPLWTWDPESAGQRLEGHTPTPMDLEIELQEEAFLLDWTTGPIVSHDDGYEALPLVCSGLPFEARLDRGLSGNPLRENVTKLAEKRARPPLYGILHYEACRLVFQPLSVLKDDGPDYITLSQDKISQAALVKAMKFT
jgi:hypothetical protein